MYFSHNIEPTLDDDERTNEELGDVMADDDPGEGVTERVADGMTEDAAAEMEVGSTENLVEHRSENELTQAVGDENTPDDTADQIREQIPEQTEGHTPHFQLGGDEDDDSPLGVENGEPGLQRKASAVKIQSGKSRLYNLF